MALRLRRGTDAERQLITPAEGELIYTTDTKSVYIGDGTTVGGVLISGEARLSNLPEVDLSTPPTVGQVLKWDGLQFVPSDDIFSTGNGIAEGVVEGSNYRINIIGDDSSVLVNTSTNTFTGNLIGDVSGTTFGTHIGNVLGNVLGDTFGNHEGNVVGNLTGRVTGDVVGLDNTVLVDHVQSKIDGEFVGRVTGIVQASVLGSDSSIIIDHENNAIFGNTFGTHEGNVLGDVTGSVFADDSTLMIDSVSSLIVGEVENLRVTTRDLTVISDLGDPISVRASTAGGGSGPNLLYSASRNNLISPQILQAGDTILDLIASGFDGIDYTTPAAVIKLGVDRYTSAVGTNVLPGRIVFVTFDESGNATISNAMVFNRFGRLGINTDDPQEKLDVRGNGIFSGEVQAAAFKGSLMSDDSSTIIDGINGNITAPGYIQFGSFTTTERDLFVASNGMVVYNSTDNRFQGYQNGGWINLDDGTAA